MEPQPSLRGHYEALTSLVRLQHRNKKQYASLKQEAEETKTLLCVCSTVRFLFSSFLPSFRPFRVHFTLPLSWKCVTDPRLTKVKYKGGNYHRYVKAHCAALHKLTAIKQPVCFYADVYGARGEGWITAVKVLYRGIGVWAACPAWKPAEQEPMSDAVKQQ